MYSPEQTPEIMRVHKLTNEHEVSLFVKGEVDAFTAPHLNREISSALDESQRVFLNLDGVSIFSAAGINGLVEASKRARANNQYLTITNPSEIVKKLMVICGVDEFLLDNHQQ
jgi:anti-sigma B factor antagonist